MRMSEKSFGPKSEEVAGIWRKLHREKLYDYHSSSHIKMVIQFKQNKMMCACSLRGEKMNT